jgi:hypothetical protein
MPFFGRKLAAEADMVVPPHSEKLVVSAYASQNVAP